MRKSIKPLPLPLTFYLQPEQTPKSEKNESVRPENDNYRLIKPEKFDELLTAGR